jgi:hypothetical protein
MSLHTLSHSLQERTPFCINNIHVAELAPYISGLGLMQGLVRIYNVLLRISHHTVPTFSVYFIHFFNNRNFNANNSFSQIFRHQLVIFKF